MPNEHLHGVHTAIITPFTGEKVDYTGLESLVEHQIKSGVQGIVAVGTTGESPTLSHEEHTEAIRTVARAARGRVMVLAGTGSNATDEAISLTRAADAEEGVGGMLIVAPYYNKPSQEGVFRHFSVIAQSTQKPIVLYSIPARCGIEISVDTCARLHEKFPHIAGIKEAGGNCAKVVALRRKMGSNFVILSGDDGLTLPFMSLGAKGVVSVASNLIPQEMVEMVRLALDDRFAEALDKEQRFSRLFDLLFIEPNPVPVKTAMAVCGLISSPHVRLPLCEMAEGTRRELIAEMVRLRLQKQEF